MTVLFVMAAILAASCGDDTVTSPLPPTDAASVGAADAIAEALDVGALYTEESYAANATSDPLGALIIANDEAAERWRAIEGPTEVMAQIDASARVADDLSALVERYTPLLENPATANAALPDFLAENAEIGARAVDADLALWDLAVVELRAGGTVAGAYLVDAVTIQYQSADVVVELLEALELVATDPPAGVAAMEGPIDAVLAAAEPLRALQPPAELAAFHGRFLGFLEGYAEAVEPIVDAISANLTPATSDLVAINSLAEIAPELNAERSRLVASALRGELP